MTGVTRNGLSWVAAAGLLLVACRTPVGTAPPPQGWANHAPTAVEQVVDREKTQLLKVRQGQYTTWVRVPNVGAEVGDYILLGQGTAERDVEIPELDARVPELVEIAHARAVDFESAQSAVVARIPEGAIGVGTVFAELSERADQEVVVFGVVTRVAGAIGWHWVHLRDASGDPALAGYDLTIQTKDNVLEGQRVAYRGRLRKEVDLGFGYYYDALVEQAEYLE